MSVDAGDEDELIKYNAVSFQRYFQPLIGDRPHAPVVERKLVALTDRCRERLGQHRARTLVADIEHNYAGTVAGGMTWIARRNDVVSGRRPKVVAALEAAILDYLSVR